MEQVGTSPLTIETFDKHLHNFVKASFEFGEACSARQFKEQNIENIQRNTLWTMAQESKNGTVENPKGGTPISFVYRYTVAKFNAPQFDHLVNVLYKDLQQFLPNVYMSLYFKQLVSQQTLVWSLLHDSDSTITYDLWTKVLETISKLFYMTNIPKSTRCTSLSFIQISTLCSA